jgi:hypothetical protein
MFEHELKAAVAQMAGGEFSPPLRGGEFCGESPRLRAYQRIHQLIGRMH